MIAAVASLLRGGKYHYEVATMPAVAPNGVDLVYFRPAEGPTEPACAFVGAMDYLPNVDGAAWFAREVWPAVRARFPAAAG